MLLLSTRDGTLEHVKIANDTAQHLESAKQKGIINHFDKQGRGWMEKGTGKMFYLAYTGLIKTVGTAEANKQEMSVGICLEKVLGEDTYKKMDADIKEKVEKAQWGIIVEPINPTKEELLGASNEARHSESDERMIDYYARKVSEALKGKFEWMTMAMGAALGAFIVYLAANMHWIRVA